MQAHAGMPRTLASKGYAPVLHTIGPVQLPTPRIALPPCSRQCKAAAATAGAVDAKAALLDAVFVTRRGSQASREQRGLIEELQVSLESHQGASEVDYSLLGGLWELQYTTAADVLPLLKAEDQLRPPFGPSPVQVGGIYQRFSPCIDGAGKVDNIIEFSVPYFLEERKGVTLTVNARYDVRSGRRIRLVFEAANVGEVRISEGLEAFLAPALLPRNPLQHALLLAIRQFNLRVPLSTPSQILGAMDGQSSSSSGGGAGGGSFQITYLDEDLLVGRASELAGIFMLTRVQEA